MPKIFQNYKGNGKLLTRTNGPVVENKITYVISPVIHYKINLVFTEIDNNFYNMVLTLERYNDISNTTIKYTGVVTICDNKGYSRLTYDNVMTGEQVPNSIVADFNFNNCYDAVHLILDVQYDSFFVSPELTKPKKQEIYHFKLNNC